MKKLSNIVSIIFVKLKKPCNYARLINVRDKIRTRDLLVRSQTLYPAELHVRMEYSIIITTAVVINAGDRGRTGTGV